MPFLSSSLSGSSKHEIYKYEEIDLQTYKLHKSEIDDKPPSLEFPSRTKKRTKLPRAGDIWIPYTDQAREKEGGTANELIHHHAMALAREGKRVVRVPTYLGWYCRSLVRAFQEQLNTQADRGRVRDHSIKEEHVEPILRTLTQAVKSQDSTAQSQRSRGPAIISLLSSDDDQDNSTKPLIHPTRKGFQDEPIIVDSDSEDIAENQSGSEAPALTASAPAPRQTAPTRWLPHHSISAAHTRPQVENDANLRSEALLIEEESTSRGFPPEALMRNSSTIRSLARESSRTLAVIASGSAGTETAEDRESPSTPSPDTRSGKGLVSMSLDPAPKRGFVIEQDSGLDAGQQLPEPSISTLHGNESEGGESVHKSSRAGLRPRTLSPERDNRFPRTGSHTESSSSSDVEMSSGEEDMASAHPSSPPRYVSPVRRDDLAAVLLAGPSHVEFDPQLATRIAAQHGSPLGIRPPNSECEPRRGPMHTRENVAIRSPTASSSGSHGPPASPRRHNPLKRKRKEPEAGPSRRRIIWSPSSSDSDGGNGGDESDEMDEVGFRDSDSEEIGDRTWTTSDQEHVVNCLKSKEGRTVQLPVYPWVRARRLLVPSDRRYPLAALYMRGDLQFIHHSRLYRISSFSLPSPDMRGASDACLLNNTTAVIGYAAGSIQPQVSVLILDAEQAPRRVTVTHRGHSTISERRTSDTSSPNEGISCLAPMNGPKLAFLSGGHDKTMRMWTLNVVNGEFIGRSQSIITTHKNSVRALAHCTFSNTVFSASGPSIHTTDLAQRAGSVKEERLSNKLRQIHLHTSTPHVVVLEVDHLDDQMEVYDTRRASFNRTACSRFGSRDAGRSTRGRSFWKGSYMESYFARGYNDGQVRIWDLRNLKNVVTKFHCKRGAAVVHTVLTKQTVMAYGEHAVSIWDRRANAV